MQSILGRAILKTLCYSDLFDYPLTEREIWRGLINYKDSKTQRLKDEVSRIDIIKQKNGFYFLKSRDKIVKIRKNREYYSRKKITIAKKISSYLSFIPTIKLIGITGGLSINNASKDDDIDLFIVTSKGLLWTTRLFSTLLVELLGRRRYPSEKEVNDKICLNMFLDEDHYSIPDEERDLYSAHEVLQMKPIINRDNTHEKFLKANEWVEEYLPNAFDQVIIKQIAIKQLRDKNIFLIHFLNYLITQLLNYLERFLKYFQLWYMRKRRTTEVISDGIIRFHPKDARVWVMEKYKERLSKLTANGG